MKTISLPSVLFPWLTFAGVIAFVLPHPALAQPLLAQTPPQAQLDLTYDTEAFQNRELAANGVRVAVSYQPAELSVETESNNLQYQIYYGGTLQVEAATSTYNDGTVKLQDLNSDNTPEVIVESYTGGAHCCTAFHIYTWQGDQFIPTQTTLLDGRGGIFEDLDGDGNAEFITSDNSFLYAFSSYAGSFPPSLILSLQDGEFVDVTQQFPSHLRATAWQMYQAVQRAAQEEYDLNGFLAGYVAQKILLGEYDSGWEFMLARYDSTSDWGLDIYDNQGNVIDRYPDFPTALRAFLTRLGYLQADGQPTANLDRTSRVIAIR